TPIRDLRIPRTDYLMRVEKTGYAPVERIASSALPRVEVFVGSSPAIELTVTLLPADEVPEDMVFVTGGEYALVRNRRDRIPLDDFFVDRYEVSNEQYQAFVSGGGYTDPSYWKHRFVRDGAGAELSWNDAMQLFTDRTGLPGPRSWRGQQYRDGEDMHPVTDVTWYEAAAYAEFVGKSLPTVYQWEKAARDGEYTHFAGIVMPWGWVGPGETTRGRANFSGTGTQPVDGYPFGVSPFGARGMAGNVKEWVFNEIGDGRMVTGGSWEEPPYIFRAFGSVSAFFSSGVIGFRLVRNTEGAASDQGSAPIVRDEYTPSYTPMDEATFRSLLTHYRYDPWQLQPEIVETVEADGWTREKIRLPGPDDDDILAYLYLPKSAVPPFQTMVLVPGVNAFYETVFDAAEWLMGPNIRAGRALFVVVMKGMVEQEMEPGYVNPPIASVGFRDMMVLRGTELRRGIDYLETRDDIDTDRLAYVGFSWGAATRALYGMIDDRYQCAVLIGGGINPRLQTALLEANSMNFIPFYPPTLMINGKNDEEIPYYTQALPQWNLLPEPKKSVFVEGAGHVPPLEVRVPAINEWLDERLGPVRVR
ncbi:MAG: SUMF1/EgtB/PvdO family nonheme iron enzyme, partial [Gemmatimonadales bacterium]